MTVRTLTKFRNPDRTSDLNERLSTLINKGVFSGGQVTPVAGSLAVDVQPFSAIGADGMVTLLEGTPERVSVTAGITQYVILHAEYRANSAPVVEFEVLSQSAFAALTSSELEVRLVLARLGLPVGATEVDPDLIDLTTSDRIDQLGRFFLRGSVEDVTDLPDYASPATGETTQNRIGDVYYVENERLFYAWQDEGGAEGWLQIISTAAEQRLDDHKENKDDGTIPPDYYEAQHVSVDFRESTDEGSASKKTMPSAGSDFGAGNAVVDERYPIAVRQRVEITGLVAATSLQLTGWYYIGKGAIGTAKNFFRLAEPGEEAPFDGTDNNKITIAEVRDPTGTTQLTPSLDADTVGFYEDPWLVLDFGATGDSDVTGSVSVVCWALKYLGQLTPAEQVDGAFFGLFDAETIHYPGKTGAASFSSPVYSLSAGDAEGAIDALLGEVNKRVAKSGDTIAVQGDSATPGLVSTGGSSSSSSPGGTGLKGTGGTTAVTSGTGGTGVEGTGATGFNTNGKGGAGIVGTGGEGGTLSGIGVQGIGGASDTVQAGIGVHGVGGEVNDTSTLGNIGVLGEGSDAQDENGGTGVEGIGGGSTGGIGGHGVKGTGGDGPILGGAGVSGIGGDGSGSNDGPGVEGVGGGSFGAGLSGTGADNSAGSSNAGHGVVGTGGEATGSSSTGGTGVVGTGGPNTVGSPGYGGVGLLATGGAGSLTGGRGVRGVGGSPDGTGVRGEGGSTNGVGVEALGSGTGDGLVATGGATGDGVTASGGSTSGVGVRATGTGGSEAVHAGTNTSSGYGLVAESDTTSPTRAALRIVPQDNDPTVGAPGDVRTSSTGDVRICTSGTGPVFKTLALQELIYQFQLSNWTARTSQFGSDAVNMLLYESSLGLFLAGGANGKLSTSPRGVNWTARTSQFGSDAIYSSIFAEGLFVIGGANGKLSTSPDGATWTAQTSQFGTDTILDMAHNGTTFVIVGTNGKLSSSPDGITWSSRTSQFGSDGIFAVTYGGLFVAVGMTGKLSTSSDGVTWTARTSQFGTTWINDAAYGNGTYVIVGNSGKISSSTDGITWTARTSGLASNLEHVTFGNGLFVAGGDAAGTNGLVTSPDGITWTVRDSELDSAIDVGGIAYGDAGWVVAAASANLVTSLDGFSWTRQAVETNSQAALYGDGVYIVAGLSGGLSTSLAIR